jgi:hypothetical protein
MAHFTGSQSKKSEQKKKGSKNTKTCTKISSRRETQTLRTNTNTTVLRAQSHGEEVSTFWFRGGGERERRNLDFLCDFFPTSSSHVSCAVSTSEAIGEAAETDFLRSFSIRGSEGTKIVFLQDP